MGRMMSFLNLTSSDRLQLVSPKYILRNDFIANKLVGKQKQKDIKHIFIHSDNYYYLLRSCINFRCILIIYQIVNI